ncbi:MAG: hypothetical protein ACFFD3_00335 [Candidatus Thorarchaeota archaeon]
MEDRRSGGPTYAEEPSLIYKIAKYWIHGLAYSFLMGFITIGLLFAIVFLLIIASIIGIIIGFALIFLAIGWLNKTITGYIWKIECRGGWQSLLGHGLMLFVALLIVSLPLIFVSYYIYSNFFVGIIFDYGILAIVNGVIAKAVATYFQEKAAIYGYTPGTKGGRTPASPMTTCPYCNAVFPYREIDLSIEGTAPCRTCGAIIQDPRYAPGGPRRPGLPRDQGPGPGDTGPSEWG